MYAFFFTVVLLAFLAVQTQAQVANTPAMKANEQRLYAQFGLQDAFTVTLGYMHALPLSSPEHPLVLSAELAVPIASFDVHDYRTTVRAAYTITRLGNMAAVGGIGLIARGTQNDIFNAFNVGSEASIAVGYYTDTWFASASTRYDKAWATHISHTDWYRTYFYTGAQDGWYSSTAGNLSYSISGGIAVDRSEITLQAGLSTTEQLRLPLLPWHGTLGYNYRL